MSDSVSNEAGVGIAALATDAEGAPLVVPVSEPGLFSKIFAPYRYMFRPRECGRVMASAPWLATLGFILGILAIGSAVVLAMIVSQMVEYDWQLQANGNQNSLVHRTIYEAWESLRTPRTSPTLVALGAIGVANLWVLIWTLVFAWILLPIVHRAGSAMRSFFRATRAAAGFVGPVTLLALGIGLSMALIDNYDDIERAKNQTFGAVWMVEYVAVGLIVLIALVIAAIGRWTRLAAIGARSAVPPPITPLTCEACGYDLTHLSDAGRCTECGTATDVSVDPGIRRTGIEWEREPSIANWVNANWQLLTKPYTFYQRMRMRTAEASGFAFAFRNYVVIGLLSAVSIFGIAEVSQPVVALNELAAIVIVGGVVSAVGAWLLHALVGAIGASLTLIRTRNRPFAYISKIWQYESAYLWLLWIVGHALAWSLAFGEDWMSQMAARLTGSSSVPIEALVIPIIAIVLLVHWFLRYRRAIIAVRWANF